MTAKREVETRVQNVPLFHEHWWFDAACPGAWDVREIHRDGRIIASMAFHTFKKLGFTYITMPGLSRTLAPCINEQWTKPVTSRQNLTSVLGELIQALPKHDRFELCLPPNSELALPFALCGFRTTATFTFRFRGSSSQTAWTAMEQKTRATVNSASRQFSAQIHDDFSRHERLAELNAKARGGVRSDFTAVRRVFEACHKRDRCAIITAVNDDALDVASAIVIWDNENLHYWMSARLPGICSGANSLLIWKALELATDMERTFDLDGFITPQNGLFLAKFGLEPAIRTYVTKATPIWSGLFGLKSMLNGPEGEVSYR